MSAVAIQATVPYYEEALAYWDQLTVQCQRHVQAINAVIAATETSEKDSLTCRQGPLSVNMLRPAYPSTEITLRMIFEQWGPKISGSVRGYQEENLRFYPEEFEFSIACDEDHHPIAVTSEGRSLTPHEFAKFAAQNFRRCFPTVSLPSPQSPLE